jgi:hypothetical protein
MRPVRLSILLYFTLSKYLRQGHHRLLLDGLTNFRLLGSGSNLSLLTLASEEASGTKLITQPSLVITNLELVFECGRLCGSHCLELVFIYLFKEFVVHSFYFRHDEFIDTFSFPHDPHISCIFHKRLSGP